MRPHDFRTDIIYREIVAIAEKNNGVIDAEQILNKLSEMDIEVTSGVVESRIKHYLANASKTDSNHKKA
jgi:hypothetical protein